MRSGGVRSGGVRSEEWRSGGVGSGVRSGRVKEWRMWSMCVYRGDGGGC